MCNVYYCSLRTMKLSSSKVPHYSVLSTSTLSVINQSKYLDFQNMNIHQIITIKKCCFEFLFKRFILAMFRCSPAEAVVKREKNNVTWFVALTKIPTSSVFFKGAHFHFWAPFGAKNDDTVPRSARISSIFWYRNFDSTAITLANTASQRLQHHHQPVSEADL